VLVCAFSLRMSCYLCNVVMWELPEYGVAAWVGGTVAVDINRFRLKTGSANQEYIKTAFSFRRPSSKPLQTATINHYYLLKCQPITVFYMGFSFRLFWQFWCVWNPSLLCKVYDGFSSRIFHCCDQQYPRDWYITCRDNSGIQTVAVAKFCHHVWVRTNSWLDSVFWQQSFWHWSSQMEGVWLI
jgi:hypothetical protein